MATITIALAGNPNCGKTTLFNALTGAKLKVGNWPGVTVEKKAGSFTFKNLDVEVVDLPGIYSLSATSVDERIARDYVASAEPDLIVNIVDASNMERNLYLTLQLLEMNVPLIVALNMMDIAQEQGMKIDIKSLERLLGCPVVPMVARDGKGILQLKEAIEKWAKEKRHADFRMDYGPEIKSALERLLPLIPETSERVYIHPEWLGLKLLEQDEMALTLVGDSIGNTLKEAADTIKVKTGMEAEAFVAMARYNYIENICSQAIKKRSKLGKNISDIIDSVVLNRYLGIPIFLLAMYLTFMFTINVGGCFIDFFDILFGIICVDGFGRLVSVLHFPQWLITILADGVGGGIQTVSTFIPPIGFMFLCLSILEDSGYMARAAFVMDRFMRAVGLPGKAFIPMLVGFGCNVPAIMATRTLENTKDRTLTIAMNPFMSCGARLPVYALFAAAFFPRGGSNVIFSLYLIGIMMAVLTGLFLKRTVLKGEVSHFIMELPPYHMPTIKGVLIHTYDRLKVFMFRAGKVIIAIVIVLSFLNSVGTDGTFGHKDTGSSVLAAIGKRITPVLHPLGIKQENWPATVGLFTGVFAKEAVVGTLNSLYSAEAQTGEEEEGFNLIQGIKDAFSSIPENLSGLAGSLTDPFGIGSATEEAPEEVGKTIFGVMVKRFDGKVGAFAYLLFVLLYIPCLVAVATIYRETNARWAVFEVVYTIFVAWVVSTLFYQVATFGKHPAASLAWIMGIGLACAAFYYVMKRAGRKLLLLNVKGRPTIGPTHETLPVFLKIR